MKKRRAVVEVANPSPGQPWRISATRAEELIRTGAAFIMKDGRLRYRAQPARRHRTNSDVYIRRQIYWNGEEDPNGMRLPGQVRS